MKKKLIAIGLVLVVLGAGGTAVWYYIRNSHPSESKIFVSGNIEATEVDLSFRLSGQIITLNVEEGTAVKKDQVVAELDTDTLRALRDTAKYQLAAAKAQLDELEEGTRKEEIAMAQALAKAAERRLDFAKDEYERYLPLFNTGAISTSFFDTKQTAYQVAIQEYENAAQRLKELVAGPREQQIRAARARMHQAAAELEKIELDIEHSTLKSPLSGMVLVKANEIGEVVLPGATVVTVAELDEVWLKGYVSEKDLGNVKLGQKAEIMIDTFPGKVYSGTVTFISPRAEFTPKNVQTKEERVKQVYRVKVTIPNPDHELKIGMPADGYLLVGTAPESRPGNGKGQDP
ncbi:MAG: efflux RND transporter periplasmic adaptor subunit [Thermodesulfobacteriota bacterium]